MSVVGDLLGQASGWNASGAEQAQSEAYNTQNAAEAQNTATNNGLGVLSSQLGNTNYYGSADQVYGQQQAAANMLQSQADGTTPSAAQIQMGVGQQAANAGLQSAALSQQGAMNPALAARNMLNAQSTAQQGIVATGTSQRATEQAQAQQAYSNMLSGMQQQQQAQGTLRYQQGQNMYNQGNALSQQNYLNQMGTAQSNFDNRFTQLTHGASNAQAGLATVQALAGGASAAGQAATTTGDVAPSASAASTSSDSGATQAAGEIATAAIAA